MHEKYLKFISPFTTQLICFSAILFLSHIIPNHKHNGGSIWAPSCNSFAIIHKAVIFF